MIERLGGARAEGLKAPEIGTPGLAPPSPGHAD